MACVYVIYSESTDVYYTGFTSLTVEERIQSHNSGYYEFKSTKPGIPWTLFLTIDCGSDNQARQIEAHIKKMKSKTDIHNLKKYPEMIQRLLSKFKDC